jgi:acetate---CoA ligase (ADP-forming)
VNLAPLVSPRSVAVLGASERPSLGRGIIESLRVIGFNGPVYPVNPKYDEVLGHRCYASLRDLPEAPDVVAFCIGGGAVLEQVRLFPERGVRAAVIYDGGFAERGEDGRKLQAEIAGICREAGVALCGPNCGGVLNPQARSTTFKQHVRDPAGLAGNVGMVSQSGSICNSMLADLRRFGFSLVVSSGNEAVVTTTAYLEYLVDDPHTKVIATFTEAVREPDRYVAALERAADKGKPVVVLKVGRSERTRHAVASHTGGLAGDARVFSEVLRAHRAIEVSDLDEMTEVLAACQGTRWPKGRAINVLTTSGGQAELILDIATAAGIELRPLAPAARQRIEQEVGYITGDGNPLDAWGNGDVLNNMPPALQVIGENPDTDAVVFCSSDSIDNQPLGRPGRELGYAKVLAAAAQTGAKPHYLMTMRPGIMHSDQVRLLAEVGVPVICGTRQGLGALDRLARWAAPRRPVRSTPRAASAGLTARTGLVNEFEAKRLVAEYGVPVARERLATSLAEARLSAEALGYPVVLKVVSDAIPHKSEHGLVATRLHDESALRAAYADMEGKVARLGCAIEGYLVQEMIDNGVEVFAGVARDPDFGLSIAFGLGGVAIEVMRDFALRPLPLRDGDAEAMIAELRGAALLGPVRGGPGADIASLAACLYALADFAVANHDRISEIDLNPIKARPTGMGCVVVDALIATRRQSGRQKGPTA